MRMRPETLLTALLLAPLLAWTGCATSSGRKAADSQKELTRLLKDVQTYGTNLAANMGLLQRMLTNYNEVVEARTGDLRVTYHRLVTGMEDTEKAMARLERETAGLRDQAGEYFAAWAMHNVTAFVSPDLSARSQARLDATREQFDRLLQAGQTASEFYRPLMRSVRDHVAYLSSELNPGAAGSLRLDAEQVNTQAQGMFTHYEVFRQSLTEFCRAISPVVSVPVTRPTLAALSPAPRPVNQAPSPQWRR